MIRLSGREFETVVDYCNHEDYANARVVIPKRYKLSGEDIEAIRGSKCIEMIAIDRDGNKTTAGRYDFDYFILDEVVNDGTKFVWRIKDA